VVIQPKGVLPKTNSPIHKADLDLRECSGEKIPKHEGNALTHGRHAQRIQAASAQIKDTLADASQSPREWGLFLFTQNKKGLLAS
jgi:hypothetical protein